MEKVIPIFDKKDVLNSKSWEGIKLLKHEIKIVEKVLEKKVIDSASG